jgi:hypothetical protein
VGFSLNGQYIGFDSALQAAKAIVELKGDADAVYQLMKVHY